MARELIRTTREDATGFHKPKKSTQTSILKPLDESAVKAFAEQRQRELASPSVPEQSKADKSVSKAENDAAMVTGRASESAASQVDTPDVEEPSDMAEQKLPASNDAQNDPEKGLVDLVVPPREKGPKAHQITLRLRVLKRHAEPLAKLETAGVDCEAVLLAAFRRIPAIKFQPRYIAQVLEPSGPAKWNYRVNTRISAETLHAIEAQVRGGDKAPRSALLLGQIEPAWFASLDNTIKEFLK